MTARRLVIWDFDGTLGHRPGGWTGAIAEAAASVFPGLEVSRDALRPHLQTGYPWHEPEVLRPPMAPDDWWAALGPALSKALRKATGLTEAEAAAALPAIRSAYTQPSHWELFDDALVALDRLRAAGWRQAVLSNHVPELRSIVGALGLMPLLDGVYCSAESGIEKPRPEAFAAVLEDFDGPIMVLVVGDSYTADVAGAARAGLDSILVRNSHPSAPRQAETLVEAAAIILAS